jgi:VIT1/CCC1 family predicted Fe2+/Mn2+ transporter
MHALHNARIPLLANLLNTMAGASFTVGVLAPLAAAFFYNPGRRGFVTLVAGVCFWITVATVLHLPAQRVLGGLRNG